jgi:hypothetical protein
METTTDTKYTTNLRQVDGDRTDYWMEIHAAGCSHKKARVSQGASSFTAISLTDAALEIASDFINEGSMTVEEARDSHIHFAPCVNLPVGEILASKLEPTWENMLGPVEPIMPALLSVCTPSVHVGEVGKHVCKCGKITY